MTDNNHTHEVKSISDPIYECLFTKRTAMYLNMKDVGSGTFYITWFYLLIYLYCLLDYHVLSDSFGNVNYFGNSFSKKYLFLKNT